MYVCVCFSACSWTMDVHTPLIIKSETAVTVAVGLYRKGTPKVYFLWTRYSTFNISAWFLCACCEGWELYTSLSIPILLSVLPAPPAKESEMNLNWLGVKSSCRGWFSGAEAVTRAAVVVGYRGVGEDKCRIVGCQGAACWLLGSAAAIGQVLKPLGDLTIWKGGWVWRAEDESWDDSPTAGVLQKSLSLRHYFPPTNTHSHNLYPVLPSQPEPFRATYRSHRIGEFPL